MAFFTAFLFLPFFVAFFTGKEKGSIFKIMKVNLEQFVSSFMDLSGLNYILFYCFQESNITISFYSAYCILLLLFYNVLPFIVENNLEEIWA